MKNSSMNERIKYLSVEVKIHVGKIFSFILLTGLENIFEFINTTEVDDGGTMVEKNLQPADGINFFPQIEKFRDNVGKLQYLMTELEIPVQTLSNKNQKSTLRGIKEYLKSPNGRHLFLLECIDISTNVLAETRNIYHKLSSPSNSNVSTKEGNGKKHIDPSKLRRLLSIKHDVSVWKFILHILSLINLSSASFTQCKSKQTCESVDTNNNEREEHRDEKSKSVVSGKEKINYYQCKLLFLKVNAGKATKYFQTFETDDEQGQNIIFSEPKEHKEEDEYLLSPVEFYIKENANYTRGEPIIPRIFSNYFFSSTGRNNSKTFGSSKPQLGQTNDGVYSTTMKTSKNNYVAQTAFDGSDDAYSSYDESNVNNSNLHNFNVVALSDDEA